MPYNLSEIATKRGEFRVITPRATDETDLLRLYTPVINRWRDSAARSMSAYAIALATGDLAGLSEEDKEAAAEIAALLALIPFDTFFTRMETWHRTKWLSSVSAATGVDARFMTAPARGTTAPVNRQQRRAAASGVIAAARAVRVTPQGLMVSGLTGIDRAVADAVAANVALVRSVSDDTRARIANAVIGGVRSGKSATEVARQINVGLMLSKKRAERIAADQVAKAAKAYTRARMDEAGVERAAWQHTPQENPRIAHLKRHGEVYGLDDPIWAGLNEPFCKCWQRPVISFGVKVGGN